MTLGNKVYRGEKGDKGDTEPKGEQGDTVEKGDTGPQGTKGEKGDNGETPVISTRTVLDDLMYTQSQESHCLTIRQQNPITKLWSLCEIHSFSSNGGARTSVWVQWNEVDVSYEVPTS